MGSIWKENQKRLSRKDIIPANDSYDLLRVDDQVNITTNASGILGFPITGNPVLNNVLKFNGTQWVPTVDASGGGGGPLVTGDLAEVLSIGASANGVSITDVDALTGVSNAALNIQPGGNFSGSPASLVLTGAAPATGGDGGDVIAQGAVGDTLGGDGGDFIARGGAEAFGGTDGKVILGDLNTSEVTIGRAAFGVDIPGHILAAEAAAPGTPATGKVALYAKTDGLLYSLDDTGSESPVSGGTAVDNANNILALQVFS